MDGSPVRPPARTPGALRRPALHLVADPAVVLGIVLGIVVAGPLAAGSAVPAVGAPPEGNSRGAASGGAASGEVDAVRPRDAFVPEWSWPLTPEPAVARPFEKPPQEWRRGHRGVDLSVGAGGSAAILSPADGVVSFAGTVVDRGVLSIDHGGGRISSFEPVTTDLVKGRRVARGDVLATLGGPAGTRVHCGQPCLHWGVRVDGEYVDPLSFVMDRRPSVLLPLGHRRVGAYPRPLEGSGPHRPRRRRRCP